MACLVDHTTQRNRAPVAAYDPRSTLGPAAPLRAVSAADLSPPAGCPLGASAGGAGRAAP